MNDAGADSRIPRKETFIWRQISGGVVEVEGEATHILNAMGARIWELINERHTVDDIIRLYGEAGGEPAIGEAETRKAITDFLNDLEQKGLISYETGIWDDA